ncbi:MAG TPA: histidine kinase, partial [Lentimicrobium sp.]|nr:histidine kinase [Lentimicrobium sp.]
MNKRETHSNNLHIISRLSDYTPKSVLVRIALVSGVGWLFLFMASWFAGDGSADVSALEYIRTILIFNIISEGNVLFDHIAERYLPIPEKISLRIILHALLSLLMGGLILVLLMMTGRDILFFSNPIMQMMILFGLIFIFILILVSITLRIIDKWITSIWQLEEIKALKLASDYHSLQAQLNPHFLFNNLSVLKSMITYDPEAAAQFTQNFTDVYRYVLQSKDKTTVKLSEELEFLEAFTALHKERMGSALHVETDISEAQLKRELPPLALQQLVENALKHNVALKDSPLHVIIRSNADTITVTNNVNPKEATYSEKTGLANLKQRYA